MARHRLPGHWAVTWKGLWTGSQALPTCPARQTDTWPGMAGWFLGRKVYMTDTSLGDVFDLADFKI